MKFNTTLFGALVASALLIGCGTETTYQADSVDATLVDSATGKPLADVPVVAYWEIDRQSDIGCPVQVEEAVTDKNGKFHIPGWGPYKSNCVISSASPVLYIFKEGYRHLELNNNTPSVVPVTHSHSQWSGGKIPMQQFSSPRIDDTYVADFDVLDLNLGRIVVDMPGACNWKKIPNMLKALIKQESDFRASAIQRGSVVTQLMQASDSMEKVAPQCGSPKAYVENLIQEVQQ